MTERDWWRTARQSLPRLAVIVRHLRPTFTLEGLESLDPAFCAQHGVRGLIWDVDGTLTSYHGSETSRAIRPAVDALFQAPGLRHVILSNCGEARFLELGGMFPAVPVLKAYGTGSGLIRRRLLAGRDEWMPEGPREGAVPIRKPSAELVEFALAELGVPAAGALMVGDQYWTDVAGARMAGVRSVKLPTLERGTFPRALRVLQGLEGALSRLTGPGRMTEKRAG